VTQSAEMPGLVRALGRRDLVGILVNTMVGSGMMAAPAKVFGLAHGWSFAVLGLSALVIIPMIVCFADLGSRFSGTGGPYLYARESLPGWMAFCAGWLLWVSQVFSTAALTNLLLTYLAGFLPALGGGLPRAALMLLFGALVTTITLRGVRGSVRTSNVMVVLKVSFVLAFVAVGSVFVHPDHFVARTPPLAPATLAQAVMIYIFAYAGFERAGVIAGEARTPREDVPWALFDGSLCRRPAGLRRRAGQSLGHRPPARRSWPPAVRSGRSGGGVDRCGHRAGRHHPGHHGGDAAHAAGDG
jgi:APA family basic amino acid/polyamine antiporter